MVSIQFIILKKLISITLNYFVQTNVYGLRVIFMDDHIPIRPDISLLFGRQTSKWFLLDVAFHENNSMSVLN